MKKSSVLVLGLSVMMALAVSCGKKPASNKDLVNNSKTADGQSSGPVAKIEFTETEYNFGEIIEGQVVEHTFKFKNTGDNHLTIMDAKGSCGCTVPEWPKDPIAPGSSGQIHVKFDSDNKSGDVTKTVTVTANTEPAITTLYIKTTVVPAK